MNKPKFETPDMVEKNIEKLAEIFPNCITEARDENGKLKKAVNFEMLQQILSTEFPPEGSPERYEFTWVGKRAAIAEANKPIRKTLRPCKAESKNWDTTENLYIEGDNLEVLKLLQESYLGKVKMIYIDPPYNTGNDFIYRDDFKQTQQEYEEQAGLFDEEENRLFKNTETNGRFHSDWCSMMYSRLMLAKNFLSDDGVIFISIDDNEQENLKKICDEVFGESNFIANIIRKTGAGSAATNSDSELRKTNDFILLFCKDKNSCKLRKKVVGIKTYEFKDENGEYTLGSFQASGSDATREARPNMYYPIYLTKNEELTIYKTDNIIQEILPSKVKGNDGRWIWKSTTFEDRKDKFIYFDGKTIYRKIYKNNDEEQLKYQVEKAWLEEFLNSDGTTELKKMFDGKIVFEHPKPTELIEFLIKLANNTNDFTILDFFSGSSATAHAVMQLNAEDGGHRKFIMVQLPEVCDEKSEAYKAGYKNICEIGKERLRRAGEKIKADNPLTTQDLDIGFRVFKVDSSNMNDVYYSASEYSQDMLVNLEDNIKPDRTDLDLLFGCLLDWGLPISLPYTSEQIENCTVHTYNEGDLVACFDENIPESVIKEIAKRKPLRAVFRDAGFGSSPEKINVTEIFKMLAPDTDVKVI